MDDETPTTRPSGPTAEPATSDAELSRIAREAVRQPADPRMDRQLARMGLTDGPDDDRRSSAAAQAAANAERIAHLEGQLRRSRIVVVALAVAVVVLAAALVVRTAG